MAHVHAPFVDWMASTEAGATKPEPKEALALINGVSMSAAIAALTVEKSLDHL